MSQTKPQTKSQRRATLLAAQQNARQGNHRIASELFASCGIDYDMQSALAADVARAAEVLW